MSQTGLLPSQPCISILRLLSLSKHRMSDIVNTCSSGAGSPICKKVCKKIVLPQRILSYKNVIHVLPGKELIYILPDMVGQTLLINQCLYLDLKCSQHRNMAASSLFLICFFRNTSLLSFHVANADGYHSRVNTRGSWDSPQQLIAQTCWEGGREPASSQIQLFFPLLQWVC